ncbi:hypothetical protein HID58_023975 [Brassica napus]|uniref:Uncharacterized protein n=1 Tax=Brassica napus TaxID=3708 RepID=A0ABQ8D3M7_BRANA|nr:hypothetical protein HID58_023975 [Brassica napus]
MLIFGHGVTVRAPVKDVGDGVKSGSICFVDDDIMIIVVRIVVSSILPRMKSYGIKRNSS